MLVGAYPFEDPADPRNFRKTIQVGQPSHCSDATMPAALSRFMFCHTIVLLSMSTSDVAMWVSAGHLDASMSGTWHEVGCPFQQSVSVMWTVVWDALAVSSRLISISSASGTMWLFEAALLSRTHHATLR